MKRSMALTLALAFILNLFTAAALAGDQNHKKPHARGLVAALKYPGITITPNEKVRIDLIARNLGGSDETVDFEILEKPDNWRAEIRHFNHIVSGVFLPQGDQASLEFTAEPMERGRLRPGEYAFTVLARTPDGYYQRKSKLLVTVQGKENVGKSLAINTSYPVLKGPGDSEFEFSLDIENKGSQDALFNLTAQGPRDWLISFKPAYENKQISSLKIKSDQSSTVGVNIIPARNALVGEYPIKIKVKGPRQEAAATLMVVLTGTYKISAGTVNGLLSLSAQKGDTSTINFMVKNTGTAPQSQVKFMSFKPENWKMEYKPEKLVNLKPGEVRQVEAFITPAKQALVGDYSVAVNCLGDKADKEMEFRVTVKASAAWGWVGIGIIIFVLLGLVFTFRKLGRR
ncbi:COG1470 family protein [Dethiosulfatarculus sandiegensis]|uniref:Alpha-galactosidase NEW3 domain-containing protein n=1 Tax=Dethiosulfatarculus sandiegensis TaxID=1429043 RepID=A0A0D2J2Z1_9BACT|nr:NEW3 domain-containing protein [Dethiosulfatarculus sandiegensis]KIX12519.1 hypothetical protein X474_18115 [Dethiosulfatarculus sandiegensis]